MDQCSLSLKLFKKQQGKAKQNTLFLKRKRNYKKNLKLPLSEDQFSIFVENLLAKGLKKSFFIKSQKEARKTRKKKNKFQLLDQGQIIIEALFFMICILSFLTAIQFFQSLARKEIQQQRLTRQNSYKTKTIKAPWYKPLKKKE